MQETVSYIADRKGFAELLRGGFAPPVTLLREFPYDKTAIKLEGLHFSAWSLLEHMRHRQDVILRYMRDPGSVKDHWPEPYWPRDAAPGSELTWYETLDRFESDLKQAVAMTSQPDETWHRRQANGCSIFLAAVELLQHNAYHTGQLKTLGRQLGVW